MTKLKYVIKNGEQCPILIWESRFGLVIHDRGTIDLQDGLVIYDADTNTAVKSVDLMELLFDCLTFSEDSTEEMKDKVLEENK